MYKQNFAPIALFAFNRPDCLKQVLQALAENTGAIESHLTIFCDGPRNDAEKIKTDAVRSLAHKATGFASVQVVEREHNMGCAPSVIDGLKQMFAKHERLIVIEDDIICSPHTLEYLNEGLERYNSYKSVGHIDAFSLRQEVFPIAKDYLYDVYATPLFNCWGWASWRDRFELVDWDMQDYEYFSQSKILQEAYVKRGELFLQILERQMQGKISSWAIRFDYNNFKLGRVGISPKISYTTYIKSDDGTHALGSIPLLDNDIKKALPAKHIRWLNHIFVREQILTLQNKAYKLPSESVIKSILRKLHLLSFAKKCKQLLQS